MPTPDITAFAFHPADPDRLVVAAKHGLVETWSLAQAQPKRQRAMRHGRATLTQVRFEDGGQQIVSVSDDHSTWVWDGSNGRRISAIKAAQAIDWRQMHWLPKVGLVAPGYTALPAEHRTLRSNRSRCARCVESAAEPGCCRPARARLTVRPTWFRF